jgi:membrane protein DedA with SNARE-associated domain
MFSESALADLIEAHGYWVVAVVIGIESMGVPLPGETMLVLAAIYAAETGRLDLTTLIALASIGAIVGDNVGYWIGREFGYPLVRKYGRYLGLDDTRIKIGQYLFLKYGAKVVFFGRFIALLRILAAFLAGVNLMHWTTFLLANAGGGVLWASVFGMLGYFLGSVLLQVKGSLGVVIVTGAIALLFLGGWLIRRYERRLAVLAEEALPGPLKPLDQK